MDVDEALDTVGGYRRWHLAAFVFLSFSSFLPICQQSFGIVFIGWEPPYHCKVASDLPLNHSIPVTAEGWSKCEMYVNSSFHNETTECTDGVHFYNDGYETIVTEFDLVCKSDYLSDLAQTLYVCLHAFAEIVSSYFSDRFGRKRVHVTAHIIIAILGSSVSLAPNYICFVILRTMVGMTTQAIGNSGVTLMMELFGANHRTVIMMGMDFFWVLTYQVPALTAYMIKDWRINQLTASLCSLIWIVYICFMSESVPWLVAKKRHQEAEEVLQVMARRNGVKVGQNLLEQEPQDTVKFISAVKSNGKPCNIDTTAEPGDGLDCQKLKGKVTKGHQHHVPLRDLFCDKKLRLHLLMCNFFWLANVLVYNGLTLISPTFGPNRFLSYSLMGLVEIPAYILCLFVVKRYGRKFPQMAMFFLTGAAMSVAAFVPKETAAGTDLTPLIFTLALVGKFGITSSFAIMSLYSRELFPTTIRSSSAAWSSIGGTIGNVSAPMASYLGRHVSWLPNLLFAVPAIIAGIATMPLPETMNKPLPLTTDDIYRIYYNTKPPDNKHEEELSAYTT